MWKLKGILCALCLAALFSGCANGADAAEGNMLAIRKDGRVVESIKDVFDREYYEEEDFKTFVLQEIAAYNRTKEKDSIQVDKLALKENDVTMQLTYKTCEDYQNFTAYTLFCGTIAEAYDAGYDLDVTLKSTGDASAIGRKELLEMGERHIVITESVLDIKTPESILYTSDNVTVRGKKLAAAENGAGLAYIVY